MSARWNVTKTFRENDRISTVTYWQLPWGYLDPPPCRFPSTSPWSPWQTPWLTTPAKSRNKSTNLIISRLYLHWRVACVDFAQVFVVQKVVRQLLSVAQALQTLLWTLWKEISFILIWFDLNTEKIPHCWLFLWRNHESSEWKWKLSKSSPFCCLVSHVPKSNCAESFLQKKLPTLLAQNYVCAIRQKGIQL